MEEDFPKMEIISVNKEKDKAIISTALEHFVKAEVAFKCGDWYVLNKPINIQAIDLSPTVAAELSNVLNYACEISESEEFKCDPSEITEKDVANIVALCKMLFTRISNDKD